MQLLTQKTLSWAQHLLKAGRLGSTAGPGGPSGSGVVDFWCPLCLLSSASHRHWWKLRSAIVRMGGSSHKKRLADLGGKKRFWLF